MPEAAVHKDNAAPSAKHKIRLTRKRSRMQPVSEAQAVDKPAHRHLRRRICGADARHVSAAALGRNPVHRQSPLNFHTN